MTISVLINNIEFILILSEYNLNLASFTNLEIKFY